MTRPAGGPKKKTKEPRESLYIGIDGEGIGRGPHRYVLLCAKSEQGREWEASDMRGLGTVECLDFILSLPRGSKVFGYAFGYDLTKILGDVPDGAIYRLLRPELRQPPAVSKRQSPVPVVLWLCDCAVLNWGHDPCSRCKKPRSQVEYRLNFQAGKFSVSQGNRRTVIWDVFRFYGCKFTKALSDWRILDKDDIQAIEEMKGKRGSFESEGMVAITRYCFQECWALAKLVRKLKTAHDDVGLELKSFYGAGSTGGAILTQLGIAEQRREPPDEMRRAVAAAFFGGRFEHSVIGSVPGPVYSYDISSAYPYQITFLPCLVHGRWSKTTDHDRVLRARHALCRYVHARPFHGMWAPLPFRTRDGTIVFPMESGGGWVWRDEFRAAMKLFPESIVMTEAWVLEGRCRCQPFKMIPRYYLNRIRLGKEGAGIVLKLGPNSVYGKLAQSVGKPPFQCWIWAGMITSGTRAQLLDLLALHRDPSNVLAMATDGLYSLENVEPPAPRDTGTGRAFGPSDEIVTKPLGGWEKKVVAKGVFFARPGVYFPLDPTKDEIEAVRARGIGRKAMHESWHRLVEAYEKRKSSVVLCELDRFVGAKSSVHRKGDQVVRGDSYGEWVKRPVELSLSPFPKRSAVVGQKDKTFGLLAPRRMPRDVESAAYSRGLLSPESRELLAASIEQEEQPYAEFEILDET